MKEQKAKFKKYRVVPKDLINVYDEPSFDGKVVGFATKLFRLTITKESGNFGYAKEIKGWINLLKTERI